MDLDTRPVAAPPVDSVLLVSFGGPEGPDDVVPFLENVTRGRGIPPERLKEVGRHYLEEFGGVSPINEQCRALLKALRDELDLPVYWGNRNWQPYLSDTMAEMVADGRRHALALMTSAFPSYSGCRQYREDVWKHLPDGLTVTKVRHYWAEEGFLEPMRRNVADASIGLTDPRLVFTAHSIPLSMAASSGPDGNAYVDTLRLACAAIAGESAWDLVFQSRSGPPQVPWLEPDVGDHVTSLVQHGISEFVVIPIGFTSDHVEVVYDLDLQLRRQVPEAVIHRAATVGTDPAFVSMLAGLVQERIGAPEELADHGAPCTYDRCPVQCCPPPARR